MKTSSARLKKGSAIMIVFIFLVIASIAVLAFISFKMLPANKTNVDKVAKTATETDSPKPGHSSPTPSPTLPSCLPDPKGVCLKFPKP